ncbi:MAG: RNA polymerase Rpb6 [Bacteroidetes bacterium]|nr:MAG: RNA polymerase Rpb6 [Bacteroidota bacterium]
MVDFKKTNAEVTTVTRDVRQLDVETGNVYEAVAIISKRANQISAELKEELQGKLNEFATHTDNLEEVFENREQIEISKFYERLPKPANIAIQEFMDKKVYHRNPAKEGK